MPLDRRAFLKIAASATVASRLTTQAESVGAPSPALRPPNYDQVSEIGGIPGDQRRNAQDILGTFDDDALLKPFRAMGNQPAPGRDIGGWYQYLPDYDFHTGDAGFAPGHCFGQWTSAMARFAAADQDAAAADRLARLHTKFAACITPDFFDKTRFPAYTWDKLNCGLLDASTLLQSPNALAIADKVRQCALPSLPASAMDRDTMGTWRSDRDLSWHWDESYTLPENLFLLFRAGAGSPFRTMANAYLLDSWFRPLARGQNVLGGLHGYSHVNALCSAMQAFLVEGHTEYLDAARNGYEMIEAQSFATGGWAPDEMFEKPGSGKLLASLTSTHNTFETPCGTYAFLKLSRYLLQLTRDGRYGDAMERILFNSMFGALPLQPDGRTFYYADLNREAKRVYSAHRWPCCAGTYPQVAADYGINTYLLPPEGEPGIWVNQYLPSTIRWTQGSTSLSLQQQHDYPLDETVRLQINADRPTRFPIHLRLPAWCENPNLRINGHAQSLRAVHGFATVDRVWRDGDRLELALPPRLRLEPFPANGGPQPALAALCCGPLTLHASQPVTLSPSDISNIQRISKTEWRYLANGSSISFRPFFALGDATYTTYLDLA